MWLHSCWDRHFPVPSAATSFRNPSRTWGTNLRAGGFVRQVSGLRPVSRDHVDERRSGLARPHYDLN